MKLLLGYTSFRYQFILVMFCKPYEYTLIRLFDFESFFCAYKSKGQFNIIEIPHARKSL